MKTIIEILVNNIHTPKYYNVYDKPRDII